MGAESPLIRWLGLPSAPIVCRRFILHRGIHVRVPSAQSVLQPDARTDSYVASIRPGFHFRRSPAWDWLGWFVPIVALWFPQQIVGDLSKGSSPSLKEYRWLGAWWAAWLLGLIAGQAGDRFVTSGNGTNVGMLPSFAIVQALAWAVAFGLWVKIVMSVVRDQENATSAR